MKTPKGYLTESIANALAEYFVVEPRAIEANLFSDTGITLHDVQLKPIDDFVVNSQTVATITGSVRSVAFLWKWGGETHLEGGSSFVHSATLAIEDPLFKVVLKHQTTIATDTTTKQENSTGSPSHPGTMERYIQDQVKRIFDTLTLKIEDFSFEFAIVDAEGEVKSLQAGGSTLTLQSLGRVSDDLPLRQTLTLDALFVNLRLSPDDNSNESNVLPLLDAFSYETSCLRQAGATGIDRGLVVEGLLKEAAVAAGTTSLTLHAGPEQLTFLNDLGGYFLVTEEQSDENRVQQVPATTDSHVDSVEISATNTKPESAASDKTLPTSTFSIPLTALTLVFPNGTKLSVHNLSLDYHFDGTHFQVTGTRGISVNDFDFLSLPETAHWQADAVNAKFSVAPRDGDDTAISTSTPPVAMIHARDAEIQQVKEGMLQLMVILHSCQESGAAKALSSSLTEETSAVEEEGPTTTRIEPTSWKAAIDGGLEFLFQDKDEKVLVNCLMQNVDVNTDGTHTSLIIGRIERMLFPRMLRLQEPICDMKFTFDGSLVSLYVGDVVATLEEPPQSQKPTDDDPNAELTLSTPANDESAGKGMTELAPDEEHEAFVLPFAAKASINHITIYQVDGTTVHTTVKSINLAAGADVKETSHTNENAEGEEAKPTGGVRLIALVEELNHRMIRLVDLQSSGVLYPSANIDLISSLDVKAGLVAMATGHSVFAWKRLFETGDEKRTNETVKTKQAPGEPLRLPFVHIHPLKVKVAVSGELIGTKGSMLHFKDFQGNESSTVNDLVVFYSRHLITNVPGFVTNANVLGFNLADTASSHVGIAAGSSALGALGGAAAPVAGVLGMVGLDGIKGTLKAGQRARGAEEGDHYHATDLFRGIGQAVKEAAHGGAQRRGKQVGDKASAIDWAVGATTSATKYTNKNKSRLGGAGAGTAGFAYGMVLGGPVGAVAGALIASKSTSATIDAVDSRLGAKRKVKPTNEMQ